ncbi:TonB-dependent siderophore receptor [Marinibacterium profundimaris]|uniref:Ligand-gated channel n=1 Tax=Marinibacterium profundimaris TaxID=1679460 RepID=A0A225NEP2_9RHOB|nr:TonB-dependent siderophore receptor [Marinibacterium profundimaris]OWU71014.1 ligand-gated channel [Marinibacterium profundimaris]
MGDIHHSRRARGRRTAALLCCSALVAVPAVAQAQDMEDTFEDSGQHLGTIFIDTQENSDDDANSVVAQELWVGGKVATSILDTPASVSVITSKEIEERDADTTEKVLEYTAGVHTDFYGTDDRNDYFTIRGFQATTYRDGLTLGSMRGVREEPFAYERVEVLRGANSTLFGVADPGGSVNFVTKTPRFQQFGQAYATYGSWDHAEVGFDFGDTVNEEGTLAYRFTGKVKSSDLEYDYSRDDETFFMGGLTWQPTAYTTISVVADYLNRDGTPNSGGYPLDREYDRSDFFGEPDFNYHDVERTTVTAMLNHDFGYGLTLQANLRYSDLTDDFGYVYLYDYAGRTGDMVDRYYFGTDNTAEELIGNAILQYDANFGRFDSRTLAGVEFRDATTTNANIYGTAAPINVTDPVYTGAPADPYVYGEDHNEYSTQSVFVQQNMSLDDRFIATVGLRQDWLDLSSRGTSYGVAFDDSDDFSESSVRGALTYKVTEEISTYLSYVESVAPPSIGVTPERGEQYEVGVKYAPMGMNALFSASVYDLTRKDLTIAVVQPSGVIEREVVGESRVRGIDLEAKAEVMENLSVIGAFSYMKSDVVEGTLRDGTSISGNEFAQVPNQLASLWANYTLPGTGTRGDMSFGLGARFTGSYFFDAANTAKSESAVIFDAAFGYEVLENLDLAVNVSNLLNEQHVVGSGTADYYNPGREITVTLRHTW